MAHSKQALKRARQGERNRVDNKAKMSRVKSALKALMALVEAGDATKAGSKARGSARYSFRRGAQSHGADRTCPRWSRWSNPDPTFPRWRALRGSEDRFLVTYDRATVVGTGRLWSPGG